MCVLPKAREGAMQPDGDRSWPRGDRGVPQASTCGEFSDVGLGMACRYSACASICRPLTVPLCVCRVASPVVWCDVMFWDGERKSLRTVAALGRVSCRVY